MYLKQEGFPGGSVVKSGKASPVQEMQEMGVLSLGQKDPLEKEMATHSSILAWRIPWLQSIVTKGWTLQKQLSMQACLVQMK